MLHICSYLNFLFRPVLEILSQGYNRKPRVPTCLLGSASGILMYSWDQPRALCCTPGILISLGHVVVLLESAPGILLYFWGQPHTLSCTSLISSVLYEVFLEKASGIFVILGPVSGTLLRSWNQYYKGSSRSTSISSAIRCFVVVFLEVKLNCWL